INDNAYKIELPSHYNVSATFNVAYLSPYIEDSDDEPDSWSSLFQEGEDDADAVNENGPMVKTHHFAMSPVSFGPFRIELPGHYNVFATFNVAYLSPYIEDSDDDPDSWSSLFQEGEDDADAVNETVRNKKITTCKLLYIVEGLVLLIYNSLGKSKVESWEKMKKLMKAKFLPENHRQEDFFDYHNLSQQNMNVEEVINEFDKLRMRCDVVEEEEQVVAWFLGVLKPKIADICGGLGHFARDCSNLKTLAFVPHDASPIYDTDAEPEIDEPGDELVYPDHGEALVIQRVLNVAVSKSVDDNSWLRNNIFITK
nr:reverse transcriptase domain-containing protein [Tanacetum cinerariifolium]